jgi:Cu(I)/Ag(I) efflux system membrane fusion protein
MLILASCKKEAPQSKLTDVDYYTCTMHPSVRSQDPHGKCPICGMDLVPVLKKAARADQSSASNVPGMIATPGIATDTNSGQKQPEEFAVAVKRQQQIGVTYATVAKRPLEHTIRALGLVASNRQRRWDYVPRIDGYVQKLFVFSPGEVVQKDAPVLTIYSPELLTAQKEFVDVLQMRDRARSNNSPDVLSSAEQLVASARERLRLLSVTDQQLADLETSRNPQEDLTLYSPFKGIVETIAVDQGRKIAAGDRVVDLGDLSVVWVWAQFYQDELPMLKEGLPLKITLAHTGEEFHGKISVIDPFINDELRTGRVRIDVENPDLKLRPGMYVDVELAMKMGEGLAVPVGAVLPTGLHNIAFVDKGEGKLEPRYVELGRKCGDYYEVKSGLKEGERVVSSGNFLIDAEAQVQGALKSW